MRHTMIRTLVAVLAIAPLAGSVERALEAFRSGILAGYLSSVEANAVLHGREPGT